MSNEIIEKAIEAIMAEVNGREETHHQRVTVVSPIAAMVTMVGNTSPKAAIPEMGVPEHRTGRIVLKRGEQEVTSYLQVSYKGMPDGSTKFEKSTGRPVPAVVYLRSKMVRGEEVFYLTCVRLPNAVGPLPLELMVGENPEGMLPDPAPKQFGGAYANGFVGFKEFVYDPAKTAELVAQLMAEEGDAIDPSKPVSDK